MEFGVLREEIKHLEDAAGEVGVVDLVVEVDDSAVNQNQIASVHEIHSYL